MFLRNLFEAPSTEVAIIFGRFNPPHKGHKAAWELASNSPVWFVGTNESTVGPKDPLPFDVKVEAMKTVWPEVESHIVAETSWLTLASKVYEQYPDATLLCLTDEEWVTKTIVQYNGKEGAHGFYNFKNITQKPTPRLSSATALRDAVSKGDREAFTQAAGVSADTPVAGKPFFDLVAEYLLPYSNAPVKKVAKKKVAAPVEGVVEGSEKRCPQCGSTNCSCEPSKCKCKPVAGWIPGKGFQKAVAEAEAKYDADYQDTVKRVGQMAKEGPRKTVWDPVKRVYKTVPVNAPKKENVEEEPNAHRIRLTVTDPNADVHLRTKEMQKTVRVTADDPKDAIKMARDYFTNKGYRVHDHHYISPVGVAENFADGKNPQDKGDSKRHGINTKASVSSLRKTAKQGGRKGQLAHWLANMKAGRAKNEDAAGVGIITKQNSTPDVNKDTPRKNLKAFKLIK